jgi:hypothetical protein
MGRIRVDPIRVGSGFGSNTIKYFWVSGHFGSGRVLGHLIPGILRLFWVGPSLVRFFFGDVLFRVGSGWIRVVRL